MCGIIGFTGKDQAQQILIEGLARMEYRGYDSAGVALEVAGADGESRLDVIRRVGKVSGLASELESYKESSTCGIGHTRWATHGRPSTANAHPHVSCDGRIAVVHNGIVENFAELREELTAAGHEFRSDTDTEVFAHLIEDAYTTEHDLMAAVRSACARVVGAYGLAVVCADEPGTIAVARKDSPIVIGRGERGSYVASDVIALIDATRDVVVLADDQFAKLTPDGIEYTDAEGNVIEPEVTHVDWDLGMAEKGGYPDFMLKEIHEQPRVVRDTLVGRMTAAGELDIDELGLSLEELNDIDRVYVIACGTSYHAGLVAKNLIEAWARIPTEVEAASEFRYRDPIITPTTLVVAVSQSGETADTLAAIRDARIKGAKVFGITNVVGSPVARESDGVIYTKANKEIAVASTKSFIGQVVSLTLLAMLLGQVKYRLTTNQVRMLFRELGDTAEQIQHIMDTQGPAVHEAALACKDARSALFVGRGMGAAISCEGALKLKEVSYLHAEAYAAGEMKHGPIALIDPAFPTFALALDDALFPKVKSNIVEVQARQGKVIALTNPGMDLAVDDVWEIPALPAPLAGFMALPAMQLFSYEMADYLGKDVDQPRNLAKSVTVE